MASEQVMLRLLVLAGGVAVLAFFVGCARPRPDVPPAPRLVSPYDGRQIWAVAPLRNESGSLQADGVLVADRLAQQIDQVPGLDVVPVSRVLGAMESLGLHQVTSPRQAMQLRQLLGVDGLVVGSLSAFDPYDPPKLGLALELYSAPRQPQRRLDLRELSRAGVQEEVQLKHLEATGQPVSAVSVFMDAADPAVRSLLERYAVGRGRETAPEKRTDWRLYRISMDLYTEFVSYAVSSRLLRAERVRLRETSPEPLS